MQRAKKLTLQLCIDKLRENGINFLSVTLKKASKNHFVLMVTCPLSDINVRNGLSNVIREISMDTRYVNSINVSSDSVHSVIVFSTNRKGIKKIALRDDDAGNKLEKLLVSCIKSCGISSFKHTLTVDNVENKFSFTVSTVCAGTAYYSVYKTIVAAVYYMAYLLDVSESISIAGNDVIDIGVNKCKMLTSVNIFRS